MLEYLKLMALREAELNRLPNSWAGTENIPATVLCRFPNHQWDPDRMASNTPEGDNLFRNAVRHMVERRHVVGSNGTQREIGGWPVNLSLAETLSITDLKDMGAFKTFCLKMQGQC